MIEAGFTAILLAGRRPGVDPLAAHFGVADKALIEVAGEAMLSRVARTLLTHNRTRRVIVLCQDGDALARHPQTEWMKEEDRVAFERAGNSIADAIGTALERHGDDLPFLVTTADNPLLDHSMIDAFVENAAGADTAFALVERRTLLARYPHSRRTWLRFRSGAYSGANLFWFGSVRVVPVLDVWRGIEQQRKKGRAVIGAFGLLTLLSAALRILSVDQAVSRAGRRFGISARPVVLPFPEACIDVDKPADHALVETILSRQGRAS